jgi:hypothetical protein
MVEGINCSRGEAANFAFLLHFSPNIAEFDTEKS